MEAAHEDCPREDGYSIFHWQPWVYASCAILVLSLVGLLGILLVPIVNRVLYNHLLQFLVATAAGSLAGTVHIRAVSGCNAAQETGPALLELLLSKVVCIIEFGAVIFAHLGDM